MGILQTLLNSDCQEEFAFIGVRVYTQYFLLLPLPRRPIGQSAFGICNTPMSMTPIEESSHS